MFVGVKYYKDVNNPYNIPDIWPAEVVELGDAKVDLGKDYEIMTYDELKAYKLKHIDVYNEWRKSLVQNIKKEKKLEYPKFFQIMYTWFTFIKTVQPNLISPEIDQLLKDYEGLI